jgi:hypothetical protein
MRSFKRDHRKTKGRAGQGAHSCARRHSDTQMAGRGLPAQPFPLSAKKLPHTIPQWVADGSWFFITIKCMQPGKNQLCRGRTGNAVLSAMTHNHEKFVWHCRLCLLMPDHFHAIFAFPREPGMETAIKN